MPASPNPLPATNPEPRFIVGIDLGTTNSAAAFVDLSSDVERVLMFPVPQFVAPGEIESLDTLPSFYFEPAPG